MAAPIHTIASYDFTVKDVIRIKKTTIMQQL